jgi:hypothetical protein
MFFGFKVVIDAHYGGVEAYNGSSLIQIMLDYCNRKADLVIVTNNSHAKRIQLKNKGRIFICPDPLPNLQRYAERKKEINKKIFVICSFDIDEPLYEIIEAAEILSKEGFKFFFSGNYRKAGLNPSSYPEIRFLGYVSEADFYMHLFTSEVAVDLTNYENCLVCGAYESLEANKPIVLSKKKALQDYFRMGAVFTENRSEKIVSAIKHAYLNRAKLSDEGRFWVERARLELKKKSAELKLVLENL